jgi:hypothetical protein
VERNCVQQRQQQRQQQQQQQQQQQRRQRQRQQLARSKLTWEIRENLLNSDATAARAVVDQ